jgi:alpha-D-xyloside xylohydrolase
MSRTQTFSLHDHRRSKAGDVLNREGGALRWRGGRENVLIEPCGRDGLRIRGTVQGEIRDDAPGALLPSAAPHEARVEIDGQAAATGGGWIGGPGSGQSARIVNGAITATMTNDGRLSFFRTGDGAPLLTEPVPHFSAPPTRRYIPVGGGAHRLEMTFSPNDGERFYGLGQHQHGLLDQKGAVIELAQRNTEVSIPFLVSSRGYGFLWNHPGVGRVELGATATRWVSEQTRQFDYWITAADELAGVLRNYADVTGKPPELPEWASGFWQCKLRYRTQEEVLRVAREFKRRDLPVSVLVIDYFHWSKQGEWRYHPDDFPDPKAMADELASMGITLMVSIWPTVSPLSENHDEMAERGLLVGTEQGVGGQFEFYDRDTDGQALMAYYDSTNPEARDYLWDKVTAGYVENGVKAWWLDACEPEQRPESNANLRYHLGNGLEVGNIYPMLHARGFWEHSGGDTVLLCRSAWAGSQRYGALVWSGDVASTFEALRQQIRAGLNMAMSGIPWWTTDIGGFHGGNVEDPGFRELLVRWFQFGVFSPVTRLHGARDPHTGSGAEATGAPNEPWSFGPEIEAILREWLAIRERLRPYVMDAMHQAHETGLPMLRPLFLGFPDDPESWEIDDQYLFGDDILVAPVTIEGARQRRVYLPAGRGGRPVPAEAGWSGEQSREDIAWVDAWTGQVHPGGQWLDVPAPLERMPVYVRPGDWATSFCPIGEER